MTTTKIATVVVLRILWFSVMYAKGLINSIVFLNYDSIYECDCTDLL